MCDLSVFTPWAATAGQHRGTRRTAQRGLDRAVRDGTMRTVYQRLLPDSSPEQGDMSRNEMDTYENTAKHGEIISRYLL